MMKRNKTKTEIPGNLVVHIKDIDSNENLSNVRVALGSEKSAKLSDDTGVVVFSRIPSGKLSLIINHPDFLFDHMQFHGKSHKESTVMLRSGENLDIQVFLKSQQSSEGLDALVASANYGADDSNPAFDICSDASIAAAMRSLQQLQKEMQEVLEQPAALSQKISIMESKIVFRSHCDPKEMAIRMQEHLLIPKWVEEHPLAPAMWDKCLQLSEALHPVVSQRDELLKTVRDNVARLSEYAAFIKDKDFVEQTMRHIRDCNPDKAYGNLSKAAGHLRTMNLIVSSTKDKLATLHEVSQRIDSPQKLERLAAIIKSI
jgi:hypothetical protein